MGVLTDLIVVMDLLYIHQTISLYTLNYSTDTSKLPWRDLVLLWESDLFCSPWFEVLPFTLFHFSSLVSNCSQWWNLNHFSWKVYVFHVCSSLFISPAPTLVLMVNNLYLLQESSYLFSWLCPPSSNWLVSLRHSRKCCIKYTVAPFLVRAFQSSLPHTVA